jgi:hypothetical protein
MPPDCFSTRTTDLRPVRHSCSIYPVDTAICTAAGSAASLCSCGDFVIRKSKPIWAREAGAEQPRLLEGAASGLHFVKQPEIILHAAIASPLIDGEELDAVRVGGKGERAGTLPDGTSPGQTRVIPGHGLGEAALTFVFGMESRFDLAVQVVVVTGREAVAQSVSAGGPLSSLCPGPRG